MKSDLQIYADSCNDAYCMVASEHPSGVNFVNDDFDLTPDSRVIDVGGYKGVWIDYIVKKYNCFVDTYEPMAEFCDYLNNKFADNFKVRAHNAAIDAYDGFGNLLLLGEGTQLITEIADENTVPVKDIVSIMKEIGSVDLIAFNCEGSEFNILDRLIQSDYIGQVKNLLIQFHTTYPDAEARRDKIRTGLFLTHDNTLNYPYTWEVWKIKK